MASKYEFISTSGGYKVLNSGTETTVINQDGTLNGSAVIDDNSVTNAKLADSLLQVATVTLTNAEIKGLAASPKTLVAAPGTGKVIEFESATLKLVAGTEVLTESDDNMAVKYTDDSGVAVSSEIEATGFIDQAADTLTRAVAIKDAIVADASAANQALVLDNIGTGEYAGNSSDNATMVIKVAYRVLDFS